MQGEDYSVLFINTSGLMHFTVKKSIQRSRPNQIRDLKNQISKSGLCPVVVERVNQLEAEATSAKDGFDFMKFVVSLAHEAMPVSVSGFLEVAKKAKLNGVIAVQKLVLFQSCEVKSRLIFSYPSSQGMFIYKLKSGISEVLGENSESSEDPEEDADLRYIRLLNKITEEKVPTSLFLNGEAWNATTTTSLKLFHSRKNKNSSFALTNGHLMDMEKESCKPVVDYFRGRWTFKNLPTLYLDENFVQDEVDRAISIVCEMLEFVYDNALLPIHDKNIIVFKNA